VILTITVLILLPVALHPAPTRAAFFNLPLLFWPLDDKYRAIVNYPDDPWTWAFLGFNPGQSCPDYRHRERGDSLAAWRDPALPEDQDWAQASQGSARVACYRGHAGTDIVARPGAPVYAVADGVIHIIEAGSSDEGPEGRVEIDHQREFRGQVYTWRARYLHLRNTFPITSGPVRAGQVIGFVAFRGTNTHLHFEIENLWDDCQDPCITNPWGPDVLWIDYDDNARFDPATDALPPAPPLQNLARNPSFADGLDGWGASAGLARRAQSGVLFLYRFAGSDHAESSALSANGPPPIVGGHLATLQQTIPFRFEAGAPLRLTLNLGNTSPATKYVGVAVRDPETWLGSVRCLFAIPPSTPLQLYTVSGSAGGTWHNALLQLSITPPDGLPDVLLDDLRLTLQPDMPLDEPRCTWPGS